VKRKLLLLLFSLSLAFNFAVIATFGHHWMMKRCFEKGPGPMMEHKLKKMLGLTDQQAQLMEKDREEMKKSMEPMREEPQKKREELFTLVDADVTDNARIDKLVNDISTLQSKIEKTVVAHSIKVKKNLTPEQRKKFREFLQKNFKKPPHGDGFMHISRQCDGFVWAQLS